MEYKGVELKNSYRRKNWVPYENGVDGVKVKPKLHSLSKPKCVVRNVIKL